MIQKLIRTDRAEHQRGVASASTCGHRGLRRVCSSEASRGSLPEEELALQGLGNKGVREVQPRRQIRFMQSGREPARMPCGACLWRHEAAPVARGRARALRAAAGVGIAFVYDSLSCGFGLGSLPNPRGHSSSLDFPAIDCKPHYTGPLSHPATPNPSV